MGIDDKHWMAMAYDLALQAKSIGEVPVGAVVIDASQKLIGSGYNRMITDSDPTQHAEIVAIRRAASFVSNYRLDGSTLYVTLEPCAMCAGAMVHARIQRLVFACRDFKSGAAGSVFNLVKGYPLNHQVIIDEGILQTPCSNLLKAFFSDSRKK